MRKYEFFNFARRWVSYLLVFKEVNDAPIVSTVAPLEDLYVPDFAQPHDNFGNTHEKLAKRTYGRVKEFWVRVEIPFIVHMREHQDGKQVRFRRDFRELIVLPHLRLD